MTASEPQPAAPSPKLRWRQWTLWSMFLLTLLVAIACSWLAVKMEQARNQREVVEAIVEGHGWVSYDYKFTASGELLPEAAPPKQTWLRKLLGDDFFTRVACAYVRTDAGLVRPDALSHLRILILDGTQVTDAGLACLKGLTQLQELDVYQFAVSEEGFARLPAFATQTQVTLDLPQFQSPPRPPDFKITDAGLAHIKGLTRLQRLWLVNAPVTDAGLAHLKGLAQLRELEINGTKITDAGLTHFQGLSQLAFLSLNDTKVGDAGLVHLQGLCQLISLRLDDTKITDAGLVYLQGLSQLQELHIANTKVTEQGVKKLQQALPNCKIVR